MRRCEACVAEGLSKSLEWSGVLVPSVTVQSIGFLAELLLVGKLIGGASPPSPSA